MAPYCLLLTESCKDSRQAEIGVTEIDFPAVSPRFYRHRTRTASETGVPGVTRDYKEALQWWTMAADRGDAKSTSKAAKERGILVATARDEIAKRVSPDQLAEGQRRASTFVSQGSEEGKEWH